MAGFERVVPEKKKRSWAARLPGSHTSEAPSDLGGARPTSMRADGVNSANAGADEESKPPAFQIIVLVSETIDFDWHAVYDAKHMVSNIGNAPAIVLQVSVSTILA